MIINWKIFGYFIESLYEYFGNILVLLVPVVHRLWFKTLSYLTLVKCLKVWKWTRTRACTHACAHSVVLSQAYYFDSTTESRLYMSGGWRNKLQVQFRQEPCVDKKKYFSLIMWLLISVISYYFQLVLRLMSIKKLSKRLSWWTSCECKLGAYVYILQDELHCGHPCYMQGASLVRCWTGKS
jgi:hypothetical protein